MFSKTSFALAFVLANRFRRIGGHQNSQHRPEPG
jgi:hypothetical protein